MDPNTSGLSGGISGHHENPPQRPPRNQDFLALRSMIENGINFLNDSFSRQFTELSEKISAMSNTGNHNHDGRNAGSVVGYEGTMRQIWSSLTVLPPEDMNIDLSDLIKDATGAISDLQSDNDSLTKALENANKEVEKLTKEGDSWRLRYVEAATQKRQLQELNRRDMEIITKRGKNNNEPLDYNLVEFFCDLREQIQKIVQKQYVLRPNRPESSMNPFWGEQTAFFEGPYFQSDVPPATTIFYLRAKLFEFLRREILAAAYFGVGKKDMENSLANFEAVLRSCGQVKPSDVSEWRKRTVECAARLDGESERPKTLAVQIANFMEPVISDPYRAKHFKSIRRLCEDANRFALVLRKSSFDYSIVSLPNGTVIDKAAESEVSAQAFDSPQSVQACTTQGSRIAFTLFGALIKSVPATGERYVLEKAHVICRK